MNNLVNQYNIPDFTPYTLSKGDSHDLSIKKFFMNNHMEILQKYIDILPKPNNLIYFDQLKTLYLLDKDLRTCIYTVLEEIETSLKSFIKTYITHHNIDLLDRNHYTVGLFTEHGFPRTLMKLIPKDAPILKLYFSDIAKIISFMHNDHDLIENIHAYFMPSFNLERFRIFLFMLSRLRNHIAHHQSCIVFCKEERNYNLKSVLENLSMMLNNIRESENQSSWLERVNNHIHSKLNPYPGLKILIGY